MKGLKKQKVRALPSLFAFLAGDPENYEDNGNEDNPYRYNSIPRMTKS
jgi:hypothetical protein